MRPSQAYCPQPVRRRLFAPALEQEILRGRPQLSTTYRSTRRSRASNWRFGTTVAAFIQPGRKPPLPGVLVSLWRDDPRSLSLSTLAVPSIRLQILNLHYKALVSSSSQNLLL